MNTNPGCAEEDKIKLMNDITDHICKRSVCGSCRVEMLMEVLATEMCCVWPGETTETMTAALAAFINKNRPIVAQHMRKMMN